MHAENFASTNSSFASKTKSQSATSKTEKSWLTASKKGRYAVVRVTGKLVCMFMMLLYIHSVKYKIYDKFCMQQVEIYSDKNDVRKSQRWQFSWQTAHQVRSIVCHKCKIPKKTFTRINACKLQCKEITQKGKDRFKVNFGFAKSQKPSKVIGRIRAENVPFSTDDSGEGLITPQSKFDGHLRSHNER